MAFPPDVFQWSWVALPSAAAVVALLSVLCFGGRYWGAAAALLGPCLAVESRLTENAPSWLQTGIIGFLILTLAALQLYGQDRSERSRRAADVEINSISTAISAIADGTGRQENRLEYLSDATGRQESRLEYLSDAIGRQESRLEYLSDATGRQESRLEYLSDAIGRQESRLELVADAIGNLADAIRTSRRPSS